MGPPYTELNGSANLAYAEVLDSALSQDAATGAGLSFLLRERKSGKYWYLQHTFAGAKKQYYLGPDSPELEDRIKQQKARWEAGKIESSVLEKQVAMTIAAGCTPISHRAYKVLSATEQAGLFRAGGVLVGSYAFVAIGNMLGVTWQRNTTLTQDVDIASSNECMIAIPEGIKPMGDTILDADDDLFCVPMLDPRSPSTSFKIRGGDFRVDLVTPLQGKPSSTQYVGAIKSYAEPVAFLEYILEDTQKAVLLHKDGVVVNVPNPARFALHKLVVSQRRPPAQQAKAKKDLQQAAQIIACLLHSRPGDLWLALDAAADHSSQKFQKTMATGIDKLDEELRTPLKRGSPLSRG